MISYNKMKHKQPSEREKEIDDLDIEINDLENDKEDLKQQLSKKDDEILELSRTNKILGNQTNEITKECMKHELKLSKANKENKDLNKIVKEYRKYRDNCLNDLNKLKAEQRKKVEWLKEELNTIEKHYNGINYNIVIQLINKAFKER